MIWPRVNREHPCTVCGKPDWCCVGDKMAKCMRVQSERPSADGGWYHPLFSGPIRPVYVPATPQSRPTPPELNFERMLLRWRQQTSSRALRDHSGSLGVSVESLEALGAAWAVNYSAWAFPMKDGESRIVGVRLRSADGRKWAVPGSSQGMFYSPDIPEKCDMLFICEGPTSTAAAMDLGFFAAGRPSCAGGADLVKSLMRRLKIFRAVLAADHDRKVRPDGSVWNPGLEGANRLAEQLNKRHVVWSLPKPSLKDVRDYKNAGGTMQMILAEINNMCWGS